MLPFQLKTLNLAHHKVSVSAYFNNWTVVKT